MNHTTLCPICGAPSSLMAHHPETDLYRCNRCTHAFSRLDVMADFEHYEDEYYTVEHKRWFDHPNTALFSRITNVLPVGASVLDVGCGRGDFLRYLSRVRPDLRLSGIDLSSNDNTDGIMFFQGDILSTAIPEHFDAIVSLAVIEHVGDVTGFVRRLHELLKPRGIVVAMTLNESSLLYALARIMNRVAVRLPFNRLYSRHHLHHFTRHSLRAVLRNGGFEVESDFDHAAPLAAIDIPVQSKLMDAVLRCGMWALCKISQAIGRNYLQTIVGRALPERT